MNNILIIGADGQLGKELSKLYPESKKLYHKDHGELNLNLFNEDDIINKLSKINPNIIINTASLTNVDKCEKEKEYAYKVNGYSLKIITEYARSKNIYLIHISTDYVFNGNSSYYSEESIPDPINYYGFSKLIGDIYINSYNKSLIVRTSGVYGYKNNFPLFVYNSLKDNKNINIIKGYYSPIHAYNLALAIQKLIDNNIYGIINIAGIRISRINFANKIADFFNLNKELINENEVKMYAKRPYDSSLNIDKAKSLINFDFYSLNSNLDIFKKEIEYLK
ncbi:NAD(P)-dependent oxidoreductase [Oxyplasma meridianum]|uniref:NAD(P)-dependent oxidoreductase n=1 Tax=Oxyplasma meridianum TaxID=3073602 RepID=A0AAX4NGA1_9ARCH